MLAAILLSFFLSLLAISIAQQQEPPQCSPLTSSNGTLFNGTAGSEAQLTSTTLRNITSPTANQGVAVDASFFYAIDNAAITKHHRANGTAVLQWQGDLDGSAIIHLDGGVVINSTTLYCPHSNYPSSPLTSSIETWDITTLQHQSSHSFGVFRGSLTWIDQSPLTGTWYGVFANYDRVQAGQQLPYGLTQNTQLVEFVDAESWAVRRSWIFPTEMLEGFSPMSNSGGSFGGDGWLYITGHDASEVYVLGMPSAGSVVTWVATIKAPRIAGQGIAWDRSNGTAGAGGRGLLYGINRERSEVVEMEVPLQQCEYPDDGHLRIGTVLQRGEIEGGERD